MTDEFHPTSKARRYIDGDPDVGQEEALTSICDLEFDLRMPYEIKIAKLKDQLAQGKVMYDAEVAETDALKLRLVQSSEGIKGLEDERLRFYNADGTFEVLLHAEEVVKRRVECAKRITDLEDALSDLLATVPDYKGDDRKIAVARANELLRQ